MKTNHSELGVGREQIALALHAWKEEVGLRAFGATCPMPNCGALAVTYESTDSLHEISSIGGSNLGVCVRGMRGGVHCAQGRSAFPVHSSRMAVFASLPRVGLRVGGVMRPAGVIRQSALFFAAFCGCLRPAFGGVLPSGSTRYRGCINRRLRDANGLLGCRCRQSRLVIRSLGHHLLVIRKQGCGHP